MLGYVLSARRLPCLIVLSRPRPSRRLVQAGVESTRGADWSRTVLGEPCVQAGRAE